MFQLHNFSAYFMLFTIQNSNIRFQFTVTFKHRTDLKTKLLSYLMKTVFTRRYQKIKKPLKQTLENRTPIESEHFLKLKVFKFLMLCWPNAHLLCLQIHCWWLKFNFANVMTLQITNYFPLYFFKYKQRGQIFYLTYKFVKKNETCNLSCTNISTTNGF